MRIRYAISTMLFWGRETKLSFEQECDFVKSHGFGIELWPFIRGHCECRYDRHNWERLAQATAGMQVSMRSRDDDPNLEQWAEQIECAKLLNANLITDLKSMGFSNGKPINGDDFPAKIVGIAEKNDVKLCIETGDLETVKNIEKKYPSIYFCIDTGFANVDPNVPFEKYVDELTEKTIQLHLTDNYGKNDDHEPPGVRGGISQEKWNYLLDVLDKYDHEVIGTFEMSPCMPHVMIQHASKFLFDVMKWPGRPETPDGNVPINYAPM